VFAFFVFAFFVFAFFVFAFFVFACLRWEEAEEEALLFVVPLLFSWRGATY
jgi:hypothetical protein